MKKKAYRTIAVQKVDVAAVVASLAAERRLIVAVDVAKHAMVAGLANAAGQTLELVRFHHPGETRVFLELLEAFRERGVAVQVAMEPTGSYGDALRHQLVARHFSVHRVDPKRCHDAKELLDGVPSSHDAKACTLIAYLHAQGLSKPWRERTEAEQQARALADEHRIYDRPFRQLSGTLEALLATYWPELLEQVEQGRGWHLHLLAAYLSPALAAADLQGVEALLQRVTRGKLGAQRLQAVLDGAANSVGVPMTVANARVLEVVVQELLRLRALLRDLNKRARKLVHKGPQSLGAVAVALGAMTALVLFSELGDPAAYGSTAAFEKALGLNLKEQSSGKHKGKLKITKRGPGKARKYLYLAALRFIAQSPVVKAWYLKRVNTGVPKNKAIVAVMRKLAVAIVHVARGNPLDFNKLFDTRRLDLPAAELAA